jgi:hypothetical protein
LLFYRSREENERRGRQRITRQHVTVPETVPTVSLTKNFYFNFNVFFFFLNNTEGRERESHLVAYMMLPYFSQSNHRTGGTNLTPQPRYSITK